MSPKEAAVLINCSHQHVAKLCVLGRLKAKRITLKEGELGYGRHKYRWNITEAAIKQFLKKYPPAQGGRGKPKKPKNETE